MAQPQNPDSGAYKFFFALFGADGKNSILIPVVLYGLCMTGALFGFGDLMVAGFVGIISTLLAAYLIQGWAKDEIPSNPPHIALVKLLGKYTGGVKGPGDRFFPLRGLIYDFDTINTDRRNLDMEAIEMTPDNATSKIEYSITWQPVPEDGVFLSNFITSNKDSGVNDILSDIAGRCVREWVNQDHEGPDNWIDLRKSGAEGVAVLLRRLNGPSVFGDAAAQNAVDASGISPGSLFKVKKRLNPNAYEKGIYGSPSNDWEVLLTMLATDADLNRGADTYVKHVDDAMSGRIAIKIEDLGIQITRINITAITPQGELAQKAELKAKEEQEREGEALEADHVINLIKKYRDQGLSIQEAVELAQIERGKVEKKIQGVQISSIGAMSDALTILANVLGQRNNP